MQTVPPVSIQHVSSVKLVLTEDGEYLKGDAFWPVVTNKSTEATRHANLQDAKKYLKTAEKRLKPKQKLHIEDFLAVYDNNFNLIEVKKGEINES